MSISELILSIIMVIYFIGASFVSYHLYKFGIGVTPKIILAIFLAGSVLLVGFNIILFSAIDWDFILNQTLNGGLFNLPL